jgi:uncharacterized protein (PEP-CTERM system associated)
MRSRCLPACALLPVLVGLAFAPCSRAEVKFTPSVSLNGTWTDNVNLSQSGQGRSEFVTELTPGFTLAENNPRLQVNASYQYHQFAYSDKNVSNLRNSGSELQADLKSRVIEGLLFLDATATRSQASVSAFGPQFSDNPYTSNNRAEVSTWSISPYVAHRIGTSANLLARYTRDSVSTGHIGYGNTQSETATIALNSMKERRVGWNLSFDRQLLSDKLSGDTSSYNAQAGLSWRVLPPLMLTASAGYDAYDYNGLGGKTQGKSWNIGYQYTPSQRSSLTMRFGRRYFGKSRNLAALHRSRNTTWNISYDESVVTSRSQFLLPATVDTASVLDRLFIPNFPDPILRRQAVEAYLRASGLPLSLANDVNYLTNRYMLQQQFQASAGLTGVRSTLLLTVYDTRRNALSVQQSDSQLLGSSLSNLNDNTHQRGFAASMSYRLSSQGNAYAILDANRADSLSTGIRQNNKGLRIGMRHQWRSKLQGNVELRRLQGSTEGINQSYTENAISATLSMTL